MHKTRSRQGRLEVSRKPDQKPCGAEQQCTQC